MSKFMFIVSLLSVLPLIFGLPLSLPLGHVQSTFDLNCQHYSSPNFENLRLIQTNEDFVPLWMTEEEIMELRWEDIKFMDVTDYLDLGTRYKTSSVRGN